MASKAREWVEMRANRGPGLCCGRVGWVTAPPPLRERTSSYPGAGQRVISRLTLSRHNPLSRGRLEPHSLRMGRGSLRKTSASAACVAVQGSTPPFVFEAVRKEGPKCSYAVEKLKKSTYATSAVCKKRTPKHKSRKVDERHLIMFMCGGGVERGGTPALEAEVLARMPQEKWMRNERHFLMSICSWY